MLSLCSLSLNAPSLLPSMHSSDLSVVVISVGLGVVSCFGGSTGQPSCWCHRGGLMRWEMPCNHSSCSLWSFPPGRRLGFDFQYVLGQDADCDSCKIQKSALFWDLYHLMKVFFSLHGNSLLDCWDCFESKRAFSNELIKKRFEFGQLGPDTVLLLLAWEVFTVLSCLSCLSFSAHSAKAMSEMLNWQTVTRSIIFYYCKEHLDWHNGESAVRNESIWTFPIESV